MKFATSWPGRLAAGFLVLLCARPSDGQRLQVRQFGVDDGLVSSMINDLAQDELGHLWIATGAGVAVYDGRSFEHYGVGEGLDWGDQAALAWDADGSLTTVASQPPFPIFRWQGQEFGLRSQSGSSPATILTAFATASGNRVAIGTDQGLLYSAAEGWRRLTTADGLPSNLITALVAWDDRLVAATAGGVFLVRSAGIDPSLASRLATAPSTDIRGLAAEGEILWLIGRDWIGQLDAKHLTLKASSLELGFGEQPSARPSSAAADGFGGLYFVSGGVLRHFDRQRQVETLDASKGIDVGAVAAVLVDRESNLWIAGERGLALVADRRFSSLRERDGLYDDAVVSTHERPDGTLVLGHRGGLSFIGPEIDSLSLALRSADGRRQEQVRDLAEDGLGGLFLAADTRGLGQLDATGGLDWSAAASGLEGAVTAVLEDPEGRLWVGTERGVFRRQGRSFVALGEGTERPHVRRLVSAPGGTLLVATNRGLLQYDERDGDWRSWTCREQGCNSVFGVLPDPLGHWVATAAGLYRAPLADDTLQPSRRPRVAEPIFFLVREGVRLWLGTENGVLRFSEGTDRVERLTVEHGLAGRETFRAGALIDREGRLWIGTDRGLSRYDPRFEKPPPPAPRVRLREVTVNGTTYPLDRAIDLPWGVREATFRFVAVTLSGHHQLRFRSWIEGIDEGWRAPYASEAQEVRIGGLEPGEYRFHVQAALPPGGWSEPATSALIRVRQPIWRQGWFLGLAILLLFGAVYAVPNVVLQRRHTRHLAAEVARRTAELRASEDRYRKTFKTIDDGVLTTDEEGRVALLNPGAEAVTGWSEAEAVGRPVEEVLNLTKKGANDQTGPALPLISGNLHDSIGPTQTAVLQDRHGQRRQVELTAAPITSGGGFTGLVFAFRDISGKQLVEAELARAQKLEAVGLLAGGIAHDFNNLLTVLLGNLSLLQDSGRLHSDDAVLLQDAESALMRARGLTHQLLTFSRGGAPVREAASITEVIRDSASFVLSGSKVRCELDLEPDLWVVEIDAGQISQVLNNLLINASQAMPEGGKVRLIGRNVSKVPEPLRRGRFVRIDIVDAGIGIPPTILGRIFDPYFSTKDEGRGLGLASAYSIVKNHEGLLTVDSVIGKGTSFHLFLPASAAEKTPQHSKVDSSFHGQGRVLVMDDDPVVRRTSGAMLSRLGFDVTFSTDGRQAIDLYQEAMAEGRRFEAVMMDLTVPGGMGGQDAMKRLRDIDPRVRAVVYSGYSNDPVLANYLDYGFAGRLSKPFRLRELRRVFETILSEK